MSFFVIGSFICQCIHNSETDGTLSRKLETIHRSTKTEKRDPAVFKLYRFNKSFDRVPLDSVYDLPDEMEAVWPCVEAQYQYLRVLNEGTKEFCAWKMEEDFNKLDLLNLAHHVKEHAQVDKNRANLQVNFGWSNGENQQRTQCELENHSGCAMNGMNKGTVEMKELFVQLSNMAKKLGIWWADSSNVECKLFQERNQIYAKSLHPDNCFEGVTVALLELAPTPSKVKEHTDQYNDVVYSETMVCNAIIHLDGKLYRISVIAYMRKACGDSIVRRQACQELSEQSLQFLSQVHKSQVPFLQAGDAMPYYAAVGNMGLAVVATITQQTTDNETLANLQIQGTCLLSLPHLDKPFSFLSPVTTLASAIYTKNHQMSQDDLIAICLPVSHLNSLFSFIISLQNLLSKKEITPNGPLGYLGSVIEEVINVAGTYSGGGFPRAQVWLNESYLEVERTKEELVFLCNLCHKSKEEPTSGITYEAYCQQKFYQITGKLVSKLHHCGFFSIHHLVHVLCQLGLLRPVGMLHHARFAVNTGVLSFSDVTEKTPNPAMNRYLNQGSGGKSGRSDRAKRIMDSVVPHMLLYQGIKHFTPCELEQLHCERNRQNHVVDFVPPYCQHFYLSPNSSNSRTLQVLKPTYDPRNKIFIVSASPAKKPASRNLRTCDEESVIPDGTLKIPLTKSNAKNSTFHVRIPAEFISAFKGLWVEIRTLFFPLEQKECCITRINCAIEAHSILGPLVIHFAKHPEPLHISLNFL